MNCPQCGAINSVERGRCLICNYGAPTPGELRLRKKKRREREKQAACAHQYEPTGGEGPYAGRRAERCRNCGEERTAETV